MNILEKAKSAANRIAEGKNVSEKEAAVILDQFCVTKKGQSKPEFADPSIANELNAIYRKTRGYDHENFIQNELGVINGILEDQKGSKEELKKLREIGAEIAKTGLYRPNENNVPVPVDIKGENLLEAIRFDGNVKTKKNNEEEGR